MKASSARGDTPPTWVAHAQRSYDSIGWMTLPHDAAFGCIDPPPFGRQCTLPQANAIAACMAMQRCVAVTCPEPRESHIGTRGITGPVCQLRATRTANERGHGMCKPGGCININLSRIRRPAALSDWYQLGSPAAATMRNPALLFVHGDETLRSLLLPAAAGLYWPLRRPADLPNAGFLFAVDAVPVLRNASGSASDNRRRYRRPDLWRAERGGRLGGRTRSHGGHG